MKPPTGTAVKPPTGTAVKPPMNVTVAHEIADLVRETCGLVVDPARRDVLMNLVTSGCGRLGLAGPAQYLQRIRTDDDELQKLIEGLTIGETYFARIPPQIRALQELVLPSLLARGDHRIRIWCAGCSTGEEPYTVALLLSKLLAEHAGSAGWDIRVIGTDINGSALAAAREGRYGQRAVSLLSDDDLQRFFIREGSGNGSGWRVGPELRRLVEFRQHNLTTDRPPAPRLDLVLCRNVLIYFDRADMLGVIDGIHSVARTRGMATAGAQRDALAAVRGV